jgi:hypothetical protein
LPVGGAINAGTVRNRTRQVGVQIARLPPVGVPFESVGQSFTDLRIESSGYTIKD